MVAKKYYAYYINETCSGVVDTWPMCQEICKGQNAKYKGFPSRAEAENWLSAGAEYEEKTGKFYAVYLEASNLSKIVNTWSECQKLTKDKKSRYKSFKTKKEAEAWLKAGANYENKAEIKKNLPEGIYFDAGTGRGIGVEVRVTNKSGTSILNKFLEANKINEHGNYLCPKGSTNNFGELLGIYIAINIALKENINNIYGDSKLVLEYWSKGFVKKENVSDETFSLIEQVKKLRNEYEKTGGNITHVSGDYNPADLGFHR